MPAGMRNSVMPVTHSPFGWPRSGVCPSRPGRCSQAPRRPRPRTGCTCASSAARRRPAPLNCPWKEKTYGHQLEGPHEAAGVLAGHRGRGGDTGARVPGTRLRGHSTRMGGPRRDRPSSAPGANASSARAAPDGRARGSGCSAGGHNNERLACVPWRLLQRLRLGTDAIMRPHLLLELLTSVLCCGFLIRRHGLRGVFWLYRVNQRSAFRTLARSSPTSAR